MECCAPTHAGQAGRPKGHFQNRP